MDRRTLLAGMFVLAAQPALARRPAVGLPKLPPADARSGLGYCDGIAFDDRDNLWVPLPFSNRLVALTPAGRLVDIVYDPEGSRIGMPTNLAWGGAGDLFVACRGAGTIVRAAVFAQRLS